MANDTSSSPDQSIPGVAVIVTGDRRATAQKWGHVVSNALIEASTVQFPLILIHGDCDGIDRMAGAISRSFGYAPIPLPAQWDTYGYPAGPRRNSAMVQLGKTLREHGWYIEVLAFHDSLKTSKGTGDMVRKCRAAGFPVRVFTSEGEVW